MVRGGQLVAQPQHRSAATPGEEEAVDVTMARTKQRRSPAACAWLGEAGGACCCTLDGQRMRGDMLTAGQRMQGTLPRRAVY